MSCCGDQGLFRRLRFLLGRPGLHEFVKFGIVGTLNTGVDYGIYIGLTRLTVFWGEHIVLATCVSFTVAVASSFVLNTFWTFRGGGRGWHRRVGRFFAVAVGGVIWNALILWGLTELGVWDLLAKAAATVLVLIWNYTFQRNWTFRR